MLKKHNEKTIMIFDIVGSFFVDCFYNNLYIRARDISRTSNTSITDMYKYNVTQYMRGIRDRKQLHKVLKSLHEYYQAAVGMGFVTFGDFEDKFLREFIPNDYYDDFAATNKDKILYDIITSSVALLCENILSQHTFRQIIDDHLNKDNVAILQEIILNIFLNQRDEYYLKFVRETIKKPSDKASFNTDTMNKLKQMFINEKKSKISLENDKVTLCNIIVQLNAKIEELQEEIVRLKQRSAVNSLPNDVSRRAAPTRQPAPKSEVKQHLIEPVNSEIQTATNTDIREKQDNYHREESPVREKAADVDKMLSWTDADIEQWDCASEMSEVIEKPPARAINPEFLRRRKEQLAAESQDDSSSS